MHVRQLTVATSWKYRGLFIAGGLVSLCLIYWANEALLSVSDGVDSGPLRVAEDALHLGDVWEHPKLEIKLPVENVTNETIVIDDFSVSCQCTSVTPRSLEIPSGTIATITLTIDLMPKGTDAQSVSRPFSVWVLPRLGDASDSAIGRGWYVRGTVHRSPLTLEPELVRFGNELGPDATIPTQHFQITSVTDIDDVRFINVPPFVSLVKHQKTPRQFDVSISLNPHSLPPGPFSHPIVVVPEGTSLPSFRGFPATVATIDGATLRSVAASPPMLVMGALRLGEKFSSTLSLISPRGLPFQVIDWHATGDADIKVTEISHHNYTITGTPDRSGNCQGSVEFSVLPMADRTVDQSAVLTVSVPYSFYGFGK